MGDSKIRVAVLSPVNGWHFKDLRRASQSKALETTAAIKVEAFRFEDLAGGVVAGKTVFNLNADVVFVRTMPAGSLEQIVFRMDLLQQLTLAGVPVINSPKTVEAAVDKYLSLTKLAAAGIPVPNTRVSQSISQAMEDFLALDEDVVVKPIFGSMGAGVERLQTEDAAVDYFYRCVDAGSVIYQQQFIDHGGQDIRLFVIGERVWGMKRSVANGWVTNITQGGHGSAYSPTETEIELAIGSARALGAEIAGVDICYDRARAKPYVLELNAAAGWKEISHVLQIDFAKLILEQLVLR
jgi:RimK family alpha-L-glutamate ligase